MLKDLELIINECRANFEKLSYTSDIELSNTFAEVLKASIQTVESGSVVSVSPFSISIVNKDGLRADVPTSALWYGMQFWPLSEQLEGYKNVLQLLKTKLRETGYSTEQIKKYLKLLPAENCFRLGDNNIGPDFEKVVNSEISDEADKELFIKFLSDKEWWFKSARESDAAAGKKLDRGDAIDSSLALACKIVVANSAKVLSVIRAFQHNKKLRTAFEKLSKSEHKFIETPVYPAENVIYYGAPGTGKSYQIDEKCDESNSKRITFHPDTQYSDFVGCLRPSMNGKDVQYTFRPGPFTNAIIAADKSDDHFYLVIEEINRASAAAVFGEIFQLLDRRADGESVYSIDLSDADMADFIHNAAPNLLTDGKLKIPSNLSILATMNSSDQAVMPMDTAFKRRWRFEYVPIDFRESPNGKFLIPVSGSVSPVSIEWSAFAQIINDILEQNQIPEDRLLGPWFLSQNELNHSRSRYNALKGKLLLYLWDDVLRHEEHAVLFDTDDRGFGNLVERFTGGESIFNEEVEARILSAGEPLESNIEDASLNNDESEENAQES